MFNTCPPWTEQQKRKRLNSTQATSNTSKDAQKEGVRQWGGGGGGSGGECDGAKVSNRGVIHEGKIMMEVAN